MTDSLSLAFADTVSRVQKTQERIVETEKLLGELKQQHRQLLNEQRVLENVLSRLGVVAEAVPVGPHSERAGDATGVADEDWSRDGRSDAVLRAVVAIAKSGRPATPGDILELLQAHNRAGDTRDYIGASLAYLNKSGRVKNVGRGQWVPVEYNESEPQ